MALSKSDQKAVKKAAQAGGLSSSQGAAIASGKSVAPNASATVGMGTPKSPSLDTSSYGIDKRTGKAIGPGNDTPSGKRKANDVTGPELNTEGSGMPGEDTAVAAGQPPVAPVGGTVGNMDKITDPLTGQEFTRDTTIPGSTFQPNKYQTALQKATASGIAAPADGGAAKMGVQPFITQEQDTSAVDSFISQDPAINTLMAGITQLLNPQQQTTTLMQDYKKLYRDSGLDEINEELIDAETVINGTEDDLRNEIQTAGGFGTESQIQALALARNKSLLKRYNQLVQMKTDATNQLNTLSQLNAQDKQIASQRIDRQISTMFNMANFRQQAINNVQEQSRWLATTMGADGLYNAYKGDPRQLAFLEKSLGLAQGGLAPLATQAAQARAMDMSLKQAQLNNLNKADTSVVDVGGKKYLINSQTGETIKEIAPGSSAAGTLQLAGQESAINQTNTLAKTKNFANVVGTNFLARWNPIKAFTGEQQNTIANIEQLRSGLTLTSLQNAKANGATFGALSDSELGILQKSGSKLSQWAIEKDGKTVGYNANPKDFAAEIDRINNYQKLDYVLKGGDPSSVGIIEQSDGSLWTQNSDGSYTEIR